MYSCKLAGCLSFSSKTSLSMIQALWCPFDSNPFGHGFRSNDPPLGRRELARLLDNHGPQFAHRHRRNGIGCGSGSGFGCGCGPSTTSVCFATAILSPDVATKRKIKSARLGTDEQPDALAVLGHHREKDHARIARERRSISSPCRRSLRFAIGREIRPAPSPAR